MFYLFAFCAIIAGSIFVLKFVLLLVGFGGDGHDFGDIGTDIPEAGDIDFDGGSMADFHTDGAIDHGDGADGVHDHGSTFLFGVISLRTVVAALTFFGLGGLTMLSAGQSAWFAFPIAVVAGAAAMFVVHFLMRSLHKLSQDGKLRVSNAVGRTATVYIPIPAHNNGAGKIQIRMQGRLEELAAMNGTGESLPTGTKVRVIGVVAGSTVQIEPVHEKHLEEEAKEKAAT